MPHTRAWRCIVMCVCVYFTLYIVFLTCLFQLSFYKGFESSFYWLSRTAGGSSSCNLCFFYTFTLYLCILSKLLYYPLPISSVILVPLLQFSLCSNIFSFWCCFCLPERLLRTFWKGRRLTAGPPTSSFTDNAFTSSSSLRMISWEGTPSFRSFEDANVHHGPQARGLPSFPSCLLSVRLLSQESIWDTI